MGRNKKTWHLELEDGLRDSVELALKERKQAEPTLNRNTFLSQMIRRALSDNGKEPIVHFKCVDPLAMAIFRGDLEKMERFFARVRNAIMGRNRCVDETNPESIAQYEEDKRQTNDFMEACQNLLDTAAKRTWDLRGFSVEEAEHVRNTYLAGWRQWVAEWRLEVTALEAKKVKAELLPPQAERLAFCRGQISYHSAMIQLAEFAILEVPDAGKRTDQTGHESDRA